MLKKFLAVTVALTLALLSVGVSAAGVFSDVTQEDYSWAVNEIEEMASKGIVKGYSSTVFGPGDDVTKIQSLLLCARILGYADDNNKAFNDIALEVYGDVVKDYKIDYDGEIAFLLYKGILTPDELPSYIGGDNASAPLKRYEAAVLITKVMDAEEKAAELGFSTQFTDSADIPAAAKPYVSYVNSVGLMVGMYKTSTTNHFMPLYNVNRAQMTVILYRMMNLMEESIEYGIVDSVNTAANTIMFIGEDGNTTGINVAARLNIPIRIDGYVSSLDKIKPQSVLAIVKRGGTIVGIEAVTVIGDEKFAGVVNGISTSKGKKIITMHEVDSSELIKYTLSDDVSVTYDGTPSTVSAIKAADYAEIEIKDGEVIVINASKKEKTVVGTVSEITLVPDFALSVQTSAGVEKYTFADGATATRNNLSAQPGDILVGDRVSLTIRYNMISKAVATSLNSNVTGTIEEITISTLPSIKVRQSNGNTVSYSISREAEYVVDEASSDIYGLRLGSTVTLRVEGETAVKVTSTTPASSNVLTGKVNTVHSSYGFILLDTETQNGDVTQTQVFLKKSGIKIINSATGKEVSSSAIKAGMELSITGVMNTGAFEATTIIILP